MTQTNGFRIFTEYVSRHIRGDEKGEAQVFLDRFFMALGYPEGFKGAGANCEFRIHNEETRSTRFADLVWKPRALIEMKKKGEDLSIHLQQAFSYWTQLVPDRPRYVMLCNFTEFWIYDFNTDIYHPLDKKLLALNFEVAGREERGEPVQSPGLPSRYPDKEKLVSADCVRFEG